MAASLSNIDSIVSEHQVLKALFAEVNKAMAAGDPSQTELAARVGELQDYLRQHCREEEEGLFKQIVAKAPQLEHHAIMLKEQHRILANELAGIARQLTSELNRATLHRLQTDFHDFAVHFAEHEEDENRLLQEAYLRDIASKN